MKIIMHTCIDCDYVYEKPTDTQYYEDRLPFSQLPDTWICPLCGAGKNMFQDIGENEILRRHPGLEPLARDHGVDLVCALGLQKAIEASPADCMQMTKQIRSICKDMVLPYLQDEHKLLSAVVPATLIDEFCNRHNNVLKALDVLMQTDLSFSPRLDLLSETASALNDYVHWEERTLFPAIENLLAQEELAELQKQTQSMEDFRSRPTQRLHESITHAPGEWVAESHPQ